MCTFSGVSGKERDAGRDGTTVCAGHEQPDPGSGGELRADSNSVHKCTWSIFMADLAHPFRDAIEQALHR